MIRIFDEAFDVERRLGIVHHIPICVVDILEILHRNREIFLLEIVLRVKIQPHEVVL